MLVSEAARLSGHRADPTTGSHALGLGGLFHELASRCVGEDHSRIALRLLTKAAAKALTTEPAPAPATPPTPEPPSPAPPPPAPAPTPPATGQTTVRLTGPIPPEAWNRLGTKVLPKLRQGENLTVAIDCSVRVEGRVAQHVVAEIQQALADLELEGDVAVTMENDDA